MNQHDLLTRAVRVLLASIVMLAAASAALAQSARLDAISTSEPATQPAATVVPGDLPGRVLVAPLEGAVDPVMLEFVTRVMNRAEEDTYDAVVFELDTPGGLSTSMDDIVNEIVRAKKLPVYVFVAPEGARAASAGVFITYAADVAAMAPGTNIGSATPISGSGQELPEDLRRKVVNDAVASIQELARERGRDAEFAKTAITKADNIGAQEALKRGVVDYVASDVRDLLKQSSGSTVQPKNLQLELEKATLDRMEVPWTLRILKPLIDGNLLMLLFGAGVIGLAFEITHPGSVLPGVVGGICLIIALWGLSVLPASGAGIGLLLLAAVLLVLETLAPGGGVFGAGAAVAFVVGALLLFDDSSGYGVSPALALAIGAGMIGFFLLVTRKTFAVRHLPTNTSGDGIAGQRGVVRRVIAPGEPGVVFVDGELWTARAADSEATLDPGTDINVESVTDMVLIVQSTEPHHVDNDTASEPAEMESE